MNYLAHFYLSHYNENLIIGNYIADDVKGKDYLKYPEKIQEGILLHRKIDVFTDTHSMVEQSKDRIRTKHRKYTPVIIDVFYDHILAKNWTNHSEDDLKEFTHFIYKTLYRNIMHLPLKSQFRLGFMSKDNWLYNYHKIEGIEKALKGLSRRANFENTMFAAHQELDDLYLHFENDFNYFFSELNDYVLTEIKKITS